MDMLCGWAEFAEKDEHARAELDAVANLYQRSAACETDEDVRAFVEQRVISLLIDGPRQSAML